MTIRVGINHNTYYKFDRPVNIAPHTIRLRPAPHSRTPIHAYSLKIEPENHFINWQQDAFGNYLARVVFPEKSTKLSIEVEVLADMKVINPFDFFVEEYAEHFPFKYPEALKKDLTPYLECEPHGEVFQKFLKKVSVKKQPINDFLVSVNQKLQQTIGYTVRMEPGVQTPAETLTKLSGSCRDSAWLMVQMFRHFGIAARFASGYLVQLTADEKSLDGPSGPEEDFTDLHAWCEVYIPGAGWVGLDPTSGLFAGEGHIPLACTPSPSAAAPIDGATDKCEVEFDFSNTISRVHEDPRVTKPYTEAQWQSVMALGAQVEQSLNEHNIKLTMGGEPTFVSIDDMESAQWNTAALGAEKLKLAKTLLLKLRDQFAPKGLLHYGQGKWYPGEEIPRWALGVFWRTDGLPFWQNPALLARVDEDLGHKAKDAERFCKTFADLMSVADDYIHPAYEDGLHYLLQSQKVPINLDLMSQQVHSDRGRRRLAKLLENHFSQPTGFLIPLEWNDVGNNWHTSQWQFRRERLILIPGDSPMGLRLPLAELPEVAEEQPTPERDPFEPREKLVKPSDIKASKVMPVTDQQRMVKQAISFEARDGKIHVFMPPVYSLDCYVELIGLLEQTAAKTELPIIIEGYEPPKDERVQKLLVTPDPGVIEVNIHPASNWQELTDNMATLYAAARESRLGTEKFMVDGRHTGTGGGNHITLGGKNPSESPFLRRPDLLRSFVTFWQHHPSLSYIFSGAFIGPTSQAPRADEGRDEMLYEMEIAFDQMPTGEIDQPWLIDRLMRNLLIDVTGNTHRAEFCIDKLFAPGSATGRLGILEFRGFEMPPHQRMALVQALLIRTLLVRFWQEPYKQKLVRWNTTLHDKYMLPHFLWQDMLEVVQDLNDHGFPFQAEWLLPFEEFRFPHYGRTQVDDVEIELRWAVEPWHVLGEEVGSFGTARYVDSSVERLQVKVSGLTPGRYVLACNGRRVPLAATGKHGEFVAGVRYKAWSPPSSLHPTIDAHPPLVFDLIDTWNNRSIGGCTYHVSHPGGRSYDTFPINANEAESRRINRYFDIGHSQNPNAHVSANQTGFAHLAPHTQIINGPKAAEAERTTTATKGKAEKVMAPAEEPANEYPYTLDLRRKPQYIG